MQQPINEGAEGASQTRGEATRMLLIHAAENLFAEKGLENVAIRAIIFAADQKNESVLQYHFGSKAGLIQAIHRYRSAQIDEARSKIQIELEKTNTMLTLREVAVFMIGPAFRLAAADQGFINYLKVFGPLMALADENIEQRLGRKRKAGIAELRLLLRAHGKQLDDEMLELQLEHAARFASLALSHQARAGKGFVGKQAKFFFENLLDNLVAILSVEVSTETRRAR
ncbi:TetR family transcriptional regulator [Pseudomonadales bacterium]|nr:TetR family transcriptional regulator [Pseudomonadales bacterium]MDB9918128.1 TetR family transcriptional regulator [Pseudomonadales bacterium]MDC0174182.1 TetR family transcriptional regulator [Pseudomonadales bacterium]MDC1308148.1 TetR family transcriptional regulator [Pseudomonadales bacterium]